MVTGKTMSNEEQELVLTRVFDAPRELVFKAWTDPKCVAQWWRPRGFTNPVCEVDVRPGGAIRIHMRGPDGTVYPMTGVYQIGMRRPVSRGMRYAPNDRRAQGRNRKGDRQ
jgi:Activator of Hsp90 ATPase homolog 1-like protein